MGGFCGGLKREGGMDSSRTESSSLVGLEKENAALAG